MTKAVVVARTGSVPALVAEMAGKAAGYAEAAKASNTRRAYRSDWQAFEAWCAGKGVNAMPAAADTVLAYLIDHAGQLKVATLSRRLSAIREAHLYAGHPLDTSGVAFRDVWRGIRRTHAARFAGHSLRSGLATSASANDAPGQAIQRQLRHKKFDTTMNYIRVGQLFKKNAAGMAGL